MDTEKNQAEASEVMLRAESDTFVAQLERLTELEFRKRDLSPSDPNFVALAAEVEEAVRALLKDARGQMRLGDEAHAEGVETPIAMIPAHLSATQIVAAWRDAERQLAILDPGSDEAREMRLMIDAYRRAYQTAFAAARDKK